MNDKLFTKAQIERTDKGMVAIASTAVEDRHGEVVSVEGWDLKNFKKNPVLLWAHDHQEIAVGVAKNIKKDMSFQPVFHDKTEKARALKALYEGYQDEEGNDVPPVLNSFSVGFRPLEVDGNIYTKQELLEISAVNVPANPEARVVAYKSLSGAGFSDETCKSVGAWVESEKEDKDEIIEGLKSDIAKQQEQIDELVKGLKHLNPQVDRKQAITTRLTVSKAIARASDKLLEQKPTGSNAVLLKVIKKSSDRLINDSKQELKLSGKN